MSETTALILIVAHGSMLLAGIIVLGLNLKLYTEILKDASQTRRVKSAAPPSE